MSKTIPELHAEFAAARDEILKRFELEGGHADRVHILERMEVPWIFSAPFATVWCAPTIPAADATRDQIRSWMQQASCLSLMQVASTKAPALWTVDGIVAVLYAHRSAELVVLMLLNPALRGADSVGDTIHEIASKEGQCPGLLPLEGKKPETLH